MLEQALTQLHTFVLQHGGVILPATTPKGGHHPIGIDAFFDQNPHCRSVFKSGIKKILDAHPGSNLVYDKCGDNSPGDHRIVAIEYRAGASSSVGTNPSKSKKLNYGCIGCRQPIGKWCKALAHMRSCCPQLCADKNGLQQRCCYSHRLKTRNQKRNAAQSDKTAQSSDEPNAIAPTDQAPASQSEADLGAEVPREGSKRAKTQILSDAKGTLFSRFVMSHFVAYAFSIDASTKYSRCCFRTIFDP